MMENSALTIDHVTKHFGGVKALTDIHLEFNQGEIVGLMGSNGAGKSTLLNIIWGVFPPDSGQLFINGQEVRNITPGKAHELGISIIFQHRRLMPYMTIAENIFIEKMPTKWGRIDYKKLHEDAARLLALLGLKLDTHRLVAELTAEEKQLVEIVKACSRNPKILLMDEPTTALRQHEVETLFGIMRNLKAKGCCVVFISHRLKEVLEVCDRVSIIRDGRNVIAGPTAQFTPESIVEAMCGIKRQSVRGEPEAPVAVSAGHDRARVGATLLEVKQLSVREVKDLSFKLHQGEILGFAGLGGSGIDDLFGCLFGLQKANSGAVEVGGQKANLRNPREAIGLGLGLVPEDRQLNGEFLELSVSDNICIPRAQQRTFFSTVNRQKEHVAATRYVAELSIKTESVQTPIKNLSGGNQQKAIIAKWLEVGSRIILMSEPTAGIDVAAKAEVNRFIQKIAAEGKAILYTSSYISELMEVSDRIIVIYRGRVFREFRRAEFDHNQLYLAMNGISEGNKN